MSVFLAVLSTVNAPYGTKLTAEDLARVISDPGSVKRRDASAFAFFSEVSGEAQWQFGREMGLDVVAVVEIATAFGELAGYDMELARPAPSGPTQGLK